MDPLAVAVITGIGVLAGWVATIAKKGVSGLVADVVNKEHEGHEHVDQAELKQLVRESSEVLRIEMQTGFARVESLERKVENGLTGRTQRLERSQEDLHTKLDQACERLARIEGKIG